MAASIKQLLDSLAKTSSTQVFNYTNVATVRFVPCRGQA